jgi:hypothetical protein
MVNQYVPIVAKVEKHVIKHSQKPWAMLAHVTQPPILSDGDVGILAHVHLKTQPWKAILSPKLITIERNAEFCIKRTTVRKKQKQSSSVVKLF